MGKNQQADAAKQDRATAANIAQSANNDYNTYRTGVGNLANQSNNRASDTYNDAYSGYKDFSTTGGLNQDLVNRLLSLGGGGGGGVRNPLAGLSSAYSGINSAAGSAYRPNYSQANAGYTNLSGAGGGFDPTALKSIYDAQSVLGGIGKTGGITADDLSGVNRQSLLNFENTGGYTAEDKANILARQAANAPSFYSNLKDQMDRTRSITGNLAGIGATDFKLARAGAQQSAQDRLNANIGLQQDINTNKMAAGNKLSDQALALAGLRTSNQLQGASAASSQGTDTQRAITANILAGLQGLSSNETNLGQWGLNQAGLLDQFGLTKAGGLDQFTTNQAQMQLSADQSNASAGAAASAREAAILGDLISGEQSGREFGLTGLNSLFGQNAQLGQNYQGMNLDALNQQYGTQLGALQASQNAGQNLPKGFNWGTAGKIAGIAGAGLATAFTGGAAAPLLGAAINASRGSGGGGSSPNVDPYQGAAAPNRFGYQPISSLGSTFNTQQQPRYSYPLFPYGLG